jgi:hypothetical protein
MASGTNFADGCRNCGTTRLPLRKGWHCKYCDRLLQRRRGVLRWQLDKPQSLKGCPLIRSGMYPTSQQLEQVRTNYLCEIDEQLKLRQSMEARLHGRVTGMQVEHALRAVAEAAGAEGGRSLFHGMANSLESTFDAEALQALYKLLYEIMEARPTRMNYKRLLDGVFATDFASAPQTPRGQS